MRPWVRGMYDSNWQHLDNNLSSVFHEALHCFNYHLHVCAFFLVNRRKFSSFYPGVGFFSVIVQLLASVIYIPGLLCISYFYFKGSFVPGAAALYIFYCLFGLNGLYRRGVFVFLLFLFSLSYLGLSMESLRRERERERESWGGKPSIAMDSRG